MKLMIALCAPLLLSGCLTAPLDALWALSAGEALVSTAVEYSEPTDALGPESTAGADPGPGGRTP
jgi:hypothetical protein